MPKKGKSDSYWEGVMRQYAAGIFKFTTGKTPGSQKWKQIIKKIDDCPRHNKMHTVDLLGRRILCKCGYHKDSASETTVAVSDSQQTGLQIPRSCTVTLTTSFVTQTETEPIISIAHTASKHSEPSLNCGLCMMTVAVSNFEQHLLEIHAEVKCDTCGEIVEGNQSLAIHINAYHTATRPTSTVTYTATRPTSTVTYTATRPTSTVTHTATRPTSTVTHTATRPTSTVTHTATRPTSTVTHTATRPTSTVTHTATRPTSTVTHTETRPTSTVTHTATPPTSTVTHTATPPTSTVTHTATPPTSTVTHTATPPTSTVTHTATPPTSTVTHTATRPTSTVTHTATRPTSTVTHTATRPTSTVTHTATLPTTSTPMKILSSTGDPLTASHGQTDWPSFLPSQFRRVIATGDLTWISKCLYDAGGHVKQKLPNQNWYYPPAAQPPMGSPPNPSNYFQQRLFLWAPMRLWQIPLRCPTCNFQLSHSGIYPKAREVVDIDSRYYLIGADYPRCTRCKLPFCPWRQDLLEQLDPSHRSMFPAILTRYAALDKKCITLMKPRTLGNSSSYIQQAMHELHSEEWGKRCLQYFSDCEIHKRGTLLTGVRSRYQEPPPFRPLPLAQWFEAAHTNEILSNVKQMKSVITSTYGRVLKLDSTKKVTKKLAGDVGDTASWMTNIANENGQVLNSVLTTGEGPALYSACQGIVKRYADAGEPAPGVIYVDRDCCTHTGVPPVLQWFRPWNCNVRLDIFHFMRRFTKGLTTEHHPLYGTFCSKLSNCIFEWDKVDYARLREAKKGELRKKFKCMDPTPKQITTAISPNELAKYCRRQTRKVGEIKRLIDQLLANLWDHTDTTGIKFINASSMKHVWAVQQKHLKCIQDPPEINLYTKLGTSEKGGVVLDVLKCVRGSSSLESFHKHQCAFIPGWRANAVHTQMYMIEGGSRWNMNRAQEAMALSSTSQTRLYDIRLMSNIKTYSQRVLGKDLLPEYVLPGKPTDETVAVEYLLAQSGKGDLRPSFEGIVDAEYGNVLPEIDPDEAVLEEVIDATLCLTEDIEAELPTEDLGVHVPEVPSDQVHMSQCDRCGIMLNTGDMVIHMVTCIEESGTIPKPKSPILDVPDFIDMPIPEEQEDDPFQDTCHDAQGFAGWEKVDILAAYLVDSLDTSTTALSASECNKIISRYAALHEHDKGLTKYSPKSKKDVLPGPWRASRKRSGSTPGVQASERLYMTHGRAAQRPDTNRISECVCIRLMRLYQSARNRPKDAAGKTLQVAHAIVKHYSLLQQLLEDSRAVQEETNLVLVTINNTTVNAWMNKRQKRADREALLQGTDLPTLSVAKKALTKAVDLPTQHKEPSHEVFTFVEPENREGQFEKRPRRKKSVPASFQSPGFFPGAWPCPPHYPQGTQAWSGWPPFVSFPQQAPPPFPQQAPQSFSQQVPQSFPRQAPQSFPRQALPSFPQQAPPSFPQQAPQSFSQQVPQSFPQQAQQSFLQQAPPSFPQQAPQSFPPQAPQSFPPQAPPSFPQQAPQSYISIAASKASRPVTTSNVAGAISRQQKWRQKKAAKEDQERLQRGEPPIKRHCKTGQYRYICTKCGKQKNAETGHTQVKGKWYCPSLGITVEEWRNQLKK